MQIDLVDPKALTPHPQNSRKHTDKQVRSLAAAIKAFGFTQPVVTDGEDVILMGHARTLAAIDAGLTEIPRIRRADLTEAQARALVIADNRLHEMGSWDMTVLDAELHALMGEGIDLSLTGFTLAAPDVADPKAADEDDVPEAPEMPVCRAGDVWHLGPHRLWIGDSRDPAIIGPAMAMKPVLMVTDPPYGVNYDPAWRADALGMKGVATGKVQNDHEADWTDVWLGFTGPVAYVWHAGTHAHEVLQSLNAAGFEVRSQIIWDKGRPVIGRGHYHHAHEPCFYAVRQGEKAPWRGPGGLDVWQFTHRKSGTGHGTQKPVEAMRRPIVAATRAGQVVFDPFMGSGTTLIAAASTGRIAAGVEIDPRYGDVAALRWAAYTGDKPRLMRQTDKGVVDVLAGAQKASGLKEAPDVLGGAL
jgi:DNA modification methylase